MKCPKILKIADVEDRGLWHWHPDGDLNCSGTVVIEWVFVK